MTVLQQFSSPAGTCFWANNGSPFPTGFFPMLQARQAPTDTSFLRQRWAQCAFTAGMSSSNTRANSGVAPHPKFRR